ncbi:hypothetical protein HJC23_008913 [Cyclotella cryptica]|uniref:Uncharacterized protein n=1 Tax=Cyclotella cryptica TaxID=29204 RepID=A0ABD3Q790_9STRA|eukprot:CCRYP_009588-RA/>CCRYP_009588-RA protein AED:0.38 eAED:0.37 QI:0/-1/0/1/-1/1/1/0/276
MSNAVLDGSSVTDSAENSSTEDEEWTKMKSMITDQLDNVTANLDDLRRNGCLESIAFQIERGDRCPSARLISWYLAMLEVEYCSRKEVSKKLNHMFKTHTSSKNKSFVLETHISRSGRPLDACDYRLTISRLEGKTELSVVERQELWLAKKNIRNEDALARKKKEEEMTRAQSAPNLSRSKQSYRTRSHESSVVLAVANGRAPTEKKVKSSRASMSDGRKPPPPATKRASIPDPTRSLSNITNNTMRDTRVKNLRTKKKRPPISDIFSMNSDGKKY